jgi:hypothetical protein
MLSGAHNDTPIARDFAGNQVSSYASFRVGPRIKTGALVSLYFSHLSDIAWYSPVARARCNH